MIDINIFWRYFKFINNNTVLLEKMEEKKKNSDLIIRIR